MSFYHGVFELASVEGEVKGDMRGKLARIVQRWANSETDKGGGMRGVEVFPV